MGLTNEMTTERRKVPVSALTDGDQFFAEMNDMYSTIEKRAFELFLQRDGAHGKDLEDWVTAQHEFLRAVPCEVSDKGNELMVRAEVPGFNQRELQVKVAPDRIFITGHKERTVQSSSKDRIFSDREYKDLFREVPLPMSVDPDKVSTMLHEGILTVFARKAALAEEAKAKGQAA